MLASGTRLSPYYCTCLVVYRIAFSRDLLAAAFHISLLQVSREISQILVIRQDRMAFRSQEIVVPDPQEPHDYRDVSVEGFGSEMFIYLVCACQKGFEVVHSYVERD